VTAEHCITIALTTPGLASASSTTGEVSWERDMSWHVLLHANTKDKQ